MKKRAVAFMLAGALGLFPLAALAQDKPLQIVMVDVEGGSATLFLTPEGKSFLVDTGWPAGQGGGRPPAAPGAAGAPPAAPAGPLPPSSADRIVAAAHALGITKIDYLLISHYHVDHVGGLSDLLAKMPVGIMMDHGPNREVFVPTPARPTANAAQPEVAYPKYEAIAAQHNRRIIKAGDKIQIGSLTLEFVTSDAQVIGAPLVRGVPPTPYCDTAQPMAENGGEENARSAGFVATFGKTRILDLSDTSWNQELKLVCPVNLIGPTDLFVVTQHGSNLSNTPSLIAAVAPRVALMGNGSRKGGDKAVFDTLAAAPSKPVLWQVHEAVRDPQINRPADFIANLNTPDDLGYSLQASVFPNGEIRVVNPRNNFTQSYAPK